MHARISRYQWATVHADEIQQLPDLPERELSLDVLGMDPMGAQRLGSMGALGSLQGQTLGSLGNLDSLGKLCELPAQASCFCHLLFNHCIVRDPCS